MMARTAFAVRDINIYERKFAVDKVLWWPVELNQLNQGEDAPEGELGGEYGDDIGVATVC